MTMNYPDFTDDDSTDDEQRETDLVNEVLQYLGPRDVARILLEGSPEDGVEMVMDQDARDVLSLGGGDGITRTTIENVVRTDDEAFNGLRNLVVNWAGSSISDNRNSGPASYGRTVAYELAELPRWLAREIVMREKDTITNVPYDCPQDYGRELVLYQLLAQSFGEDTREDRIKLWDEMLKFTYYDVFFAYELRPEQASGEVIRQSTHSRKLWHQSSSKAHNFVLAQLRRKHDAELDGGEFWLQVTDNDTTPMRRHQSGLDPMDDIEEFVFAF